MPAIGHHSDSTFVLSMFYSRHERSTRELTCHRPAVIEAEMEIERPVNDDRTKIGQLLSNFVGNALTHGSSNKPVLVRDETDATTFQLRFSNPGDAIPPDAMDNLFEPFFRGEGRASRQRLGFRKNPVFSSA